MADDLAEKFEEHLVNVYDNEKIIKLENEKHKSRGTQCSCIHAWDE
jgi:hypothetical protein